MLFTFFGGFKSQVRWPEGPPHLALKPSLFDFFVCCLGFGPFPFFVLKEKTLLFPLKRAFFCLFFECLPLFLLSLFWPPPFSLYLSLSLSFIFFFPSFLSLFLCFLLVPCFCLFLSFCLFFAFVSWKEQHQNIKLQSSLFTIPFSFLLVSSLLYPFQSPFLIFVFFLILSFVFCSTSMFFFDKCKFKKNNFWSRGGFQHKVFILTCVLQNVKGYRFFFLGGGGLCQFLLMFKRSTIKIGILAHF